MRRNLIRQHVEAATPARRGSFTLDALCFLSELALYVLAVFCTVDLIGRVAGYFWWVVGQ